MRPNFSPESELNWLSEKEGERRKPTYKDPKSKIIFFSVFSKTNKTLNQEKMFKQTQPKPKLSSSTRKNRRSHSSSKLVQVRGRVDIRNFFEQKGVGGEKSNNENCGKLSEDNYTHPNPVLKIKEANSEIRESLGESLKGLVASTELSTSYAAL